MDESRKATAESEAALHQAVAQLQAQLTGLREAAVSVLSTGDLHTLAGTHLHAYPPLLRLPHTPTAHSISTCGPVTLPTACLAVWRAAFLNHGTTERAAPGASPSDPQQQQQQTPATPAPAALARAATYLQQGGGGGGAAAAGNPNGAGMVTPGPSSGHPFPALGTGGALPLTPLALAGGVTPGAALAGKNTAELYNMYLEVVRAVPAFPSSLGAPALCQSAPDLVGEGRERRAQRRRQASFGPGAACCFPRRSRTPGGRSGRGGASSRCTLSRLPRRWTPRCVCLLGSGQGLQGHLRGGGGSSVWVFRPRVCMTSRLDVMTTVARWCVCVVHRRPRLTTSAPSTPRCRRRTRCCRAAPPRSGSRSSSSRTRCGRAGGPAAATVLRPVTQEGAACHTRAVAASLPAHRWLSTAPTAPAPRGRPPRCSKPSRTSSSRCAATPARACWAALSPAGEGPGKREEQRHQQNRGTARAWAACSAHGASPRPRPTFPCCVVCGAVCVAVQVATLVAEVSRLQGTPLSRNAAGGGAGGSAVTSPGGDGGTLSLEQVVTSSQVISARLVSFATLGELVEQNRCAAAPHLGAGYGALRSCRGGCSLSLAALALALACRWSCAAGGCWRWRGSCRPRTSARRRSCGARWRPTCRRASRRCAGWVRGWAVRGAAGVRGRHPSQHSACRRVGSEGRSDRERGPCAPQHTSPQVPCPRFGQCRGKGSGPGCTRPALARSLPLSLGDVSWG